MDDPQSDPLNGGSYIEPKKTRPVAIKSAAGCRIQKYRDKWELEENFRGWLCQAECGSGYCKACKCLVKPRHSTLIQHGLTAKHTKALRLMREAETKILYIVDADNNMLATGWVGQPPIEVHSEDLSYSTVNVVAMSTAPQTIPKKYYTTKQLKEQIFEKKMALMGLQITLEHELAEKKKSLLDAELNINLMDLEIKKLQYGRTGQ